MGTLTVSDSTFVDNSGDGIDIGPVGTASVTNSTLSDNIGVGIDSLSSTLSVTNSALSHNSLGGVNGGGSVVTLSGCTLLGNIAESGGGIQLDGGAATLDNCTVIGNSAIDGGGIYNYDGTLTVTNSTLSGNSAKDGGGIANGGTVPVTTVNNTIVADSTGGDLSSGDYQGSNDLIGDGSDFFEFTNSLQGNPLLAPLGNYGGPTQTMALLPGSPAIALAAPPWRSMATATH